MVKKICYVAGAFLTILVLEYLPFRVDFIWRIILQILAVFFCGFASFFCARTVLPAERIKWLLLPLFCILFTLPYPLLYWNNQEPYAVLKIFGWCLACSLLGLVRFTPWKNRVQVQSQEEDPPKKGTWALRPIGNSLLLVLGYIVFNTWMAVSDTGWGLVYGIGFLILYVLTVPVMTVFYCRGIRGLGWKKYLYCLYNAAILGLYYTVATIPFNTLPLNFQYLTTTVVSLPGLTAILSALVFGLITLFIFDVRKRIQKT